jgi:cell wall-associated NlpC family hydrolase
MTTIATAYRPIPLRELVGIPYVPGGRSLQGADCWGLILIAGRHLFGIEYPEFFYSQADGEFLPQAAALIDQETHGQPHWRTLDIADKRSQAPRGAIHIFRVKGLETHCAIHLGMGGEFLHSLPGRMSCVESLHSINWVSRRTGTYVWTPNE